jgi:hypothetical protein
VHRTGRPGVPGVWEELTGAEEIVAGNVGGLSDVQRVTVVEASK